MTIRLQRLASYDALTGPRNRRSFLEIAETAFVERGRPPTNYFALIDVGNFKRINDELGHAIGDEVLKQVAAVIANACGAQPSGRLGGEEFGILLLGLDEQKARAFLDSLTKAIVQSAHGFPRVTASLGLAMHNEGEALSAVIRRADGNI